MAINERIITGTTAAAADGGGTGNQEEGLILHLDANDVDSYDGDGSVWYDITNHEYTPAVDPAKNFNTVTYTGNGSASGQPITEVGFQPDLVWVKQRNAGSTRHQLQDSVSGDGWLDSSDTFGYAGSQAHIDNRPVDTFDADGFTIPSNYTYNNDNNDTYVAWCFKAGGAAVLNTDGDVNSNVSVNNDLGFSIVEGTGSGTGVQTVGHGLDVPPEMVIIKNTNVADNWWVYHKDLGVGKYLQLNTTSASLNWAEDMVVNATELGVRQNSTGSWGNLIAYCFASKRGVSKVGSYTGTGSSGNKVYTGFEPAFVMIKATNATDAWYIFDNKRDTSGVNTQYLSPNDSDAETGGSSGFTFTADGFICEGTGNFHNASGRNFIYLAFAAEKPDSLVNSTLGSIDSNSVSSIASSSTPVNAPKIDGGIHDVFSGSLVQGENFGFGDTGNSEGNNYFTLTLNEATAFKKFAVYEMYQSGMRYTGNVKVYGSNDNSNFTLIAQTSQTTSVQFNRNETDISDTTEYLYYKFDFYGNNRGTYQGAFRIELLTDQDLAPELHLDPTSYSGSGTTWTADVGGDGAITGAAYDQELGDFFHFDGNDDVISNTSVTLGTDGSSYSMEMWFNADTIATNDIMLQINDGTYRQGLIYFNSSSTVRAVFYKDGDYNNAPNVTSGTISTGKWYHVVGVFKKSEYAKIYINGVEAATTSTNVTGTFEDSYDKYYIGEGNFGQNFDGKIGQVRYYATALTADQVMQNYRFTKNDYPNGFNGTISGASWSADKFTFDGSNDKVDTSYKSKYKGAFSIWFKTSGTANQTLLDTSGASSANRGSHLFFNSSGNIRFIVGRGTSGTNGIELITTGTYNDGNWHHAVINWDAIDDNSAELFIDGSSVKTGTVTQGNWTTSNESSETLQIGTYGAGFYFNGDISKVKIYNEPRSSSEVTALYNEGSGN